MEREFSRFPPLMNTGTWSCQEDAQSISKEAYGQVIKKKIIITSDNFPLFMETWITFPQKVPQTFWCSASNGLASREISPVAARTGQLQPHTGSSPQPHNTHMQQPCSFRQFQMMRVSDFQQETYRNIKKHTE